MKKKIIKLDQIVAGALLKFGRVDKTDIKIIVEQMSKNQIIDIKDLSLNKISKYMEINQEVISLKRCNHGEKMTIESILKDIEGPKVKNYMDNLDIEDFTLRKINDYEWIKLSEKDKYLSIKQLEAMDKLVEDGYLWITWDDFFIHDEYQQVSLTNRGMKRIFILDNKLELKRFKDLLETVRYDVNLIKPYLDSINFFRVKHEILSLKAFEHFCQEHDLCCIKEGVSDVDYECLDITFDDKAKNLIRDMLSVENDDHSLYICNPNCIFAGGKVINKYNREINHVDWNDIDVDKMFKINDFKRVTTVGEAFKYINRHLSNQIVNKIQRGKDQDVVAYLAVVEKHQDNYLVRGIIRRDRDGYALAFNPNFIRKNSHKSLKKTLKLDGNKIG